MADSVKKRRARMKANSLADIIAWPGDKRDRQKSQAEILQKSLKNLAR